MASMASQLIEESTTHGESDSLEDAREICADGTYIPNNLRICIHTTTLLTTHRCILVDYFNNCNFSKHELMRSLMTV